MNKWMVFAAGVLALSLSAVAEEATTTDKDRAPAQEQVFTQDYLETVQDEQAQALAQQEQDRKDHEKYLRHIDRRR